MCETYIDKHTIYVVYIFYHISDLCMLGHCNPLINLTGTHTLIRSLKTGVHLHGQVDFHSEKCKHSELVLSGWRVKLIPASTDHHTQVLKNWMNWKPWSVWVRQYMYAICLVNHHNNWWLYNQLIWQNDHLKWQIHHVDLTFLSATSSNYRSRFRFIHIFL